CASLPVTRRATTSGALPAAVAMYILTGRVGQASACAGGLTINDAANAPSQAQRDRSSLITSLRARSAPRRSLTVRRRAASVPQRARPRPAAVQYWLQV